MARTLHLIAAGLAGLALAAAGCGSDTENPAGQTSERTTESPVDPESPGAVQDETTPAPSDRPETGRTDGGG